ncbi:hypothetical protein M3J07_000170 [Ascochyta lentis]
MSTPTADTTCELVLSTTLLVPRRSCDDYAYIKCPQEQIHLWIRLPACAHTVVLNATLNTTRAMLVLLADFQIANRRHL